MRDNWNPVYDTGCGWEECPQCGPLIEQEKQRKHESAVGWPTTDLVSEWQAEDREELDEAQQASSAELRAFEKEEARARAKAARDSARVRRVLSKEQETEVMAILFERGKKLRGAFRTIRKEWMSEVWLEILNPPARIQKKEARLPLFRKVAKAVSRAQKKLQRSWDDEKLFVLTGLHGEFP